MASPITGSIDFYSRCDWLIKNYSSCENFSRDSTASLDPHRYQLLVRLSYSAIQNGLSATIEDAKRGQSKGTSQN